MRIIESNDLDSIHDFDDPDTFLIDITRSELAVLIGGLRESLEELETWEFQTRMGWTVAETRALLDHLADIYDAAPPRPQT